MSEVFAKEHLVQYIQKIERLEHDKANVTQDLKEVFMDAKNNGFEVKTLKKIIQIRKMDKNKLAEEEALLELYRSALGV